MIEHILTHSLHNDTAVSPEQLSDMMELYLTDLHLRKVTGEFWMETTAMCVKLVRLAATVSAEATLKKVESMSPESLKILDGVIEVSLQEIRELRTKLYAKLELLVKCAPPGVKIH